MGLEGQRHAMLAPRRCPAQGSYCPTVELEQFNLTI
jgi:hypothetical protein